MIREYPCVLIESDDTYANSVRKITSVMISFACLFNVIYLWTKWCFFSSGSAVLKRDFQDVYPKNLLALFYKLSEYCMLTFSTCLGSNMSSVSGAFLYVRNRFPSLLYLLVMMLAVVSKTQTSKLQTSDLETSDLLKNDWNCKHSSTWMYIFLHGNCYRD